MQTFCKVYFNCISKEKQERERDHHQGYRYANACAGKSKNFQVLSQLIVVNIYASMCKLANEIQMCPKVWAKVWMGSARLSCNSSTALPAVCLSRLSARFSIASRSQIKVASLQLPFISFVMCSDYIKFYSGEPSSHTHRKTRGKICNLYWDGYDSISFTGMHWQCN